MQIHELNTFSGSVGSSKYLAIDDGNETTKLPSSALGAVVLKVTSLSALPQKVTGSMIKANMTVVQSVLSNPSAQTSDWTVTTEDGALTISGSISGSTELTLTLEPSISVTA